jgi:hypothetical protein
MKDVKKIKGSTIVWYILPRWLVKLNIISSIHSNNNLSGTLENSRTCSTENIKQIIIMGNYKV